MKKLLIALFTAIMFCSFQSFAAYLKNVPVTVKQPDGTTIQCFASGDEIYNFLHDKNGFVIIQNKDGYYYYADKLNGNVVPTQYRVDINNPENLNLKQWIAPDKNILDQMRNQYFANIPKSAINKTPKLLTAKSGQINNLVIFVRFSDQTEYTDPISKYDAMYNNVEGRSFKNFYKTVSYGKFDVQTYFYPQTSTKTIVSYQDSHSRDYYSPYNDTTNTIGYRTTTEGSIREQELLSSAFDYVSDLIDENINFDSDNDNKIDNVTIIVKGTANGWASVLWPHRSWYYGSSTIGGKSPLDYNMIEADLIDSPSYGLGVLCHEFFHSLGAPDLYHYSYDGFYPTGSWDLMELTANPPQFMCNYLKYQYTNWVTNIPEISTDGKYSLKPVTSETNNIYKVNLPNSTSEFLILEYRQRTGIYDISVPASGLLVYRINTTVDRKGNGSASTAQPDEIYIFRPNGSPKQDGNYKLAAMSAESGNTIINDFTNPQTFLANGAATGIEIYDVSECGDSISFKIGYTPRTVLTAPSNKSTNVSLTPTFQWRKYLKSTGYNLQIAKDSLFNNIIYDNAAITDTSLELTNSLEYGTKYYARVRWVFGAQTISNWSPTCYFTTKLAPPSLIYPENQSNNITFIPTFKWNKVNGAAKYKFILSDNSAFTSTLYSNSLITDTTFTMPYPLKLNTVYYWQVWSADKSGNYNFSLTYSFTTKVNELKILSETGSMGVCLNSSATIKVSPAGNFASFKWYKDAQLINDAKDSTLTIQKFTDDNAGNYKCVVTNSLANDSVTSDDIALELFTAPELVFEYKTIPLAKGDTTIIAVQLSKNYPNNSSLFTYQWFKNGTRIYDNSKYSGTNTATLKIVNLDLSESQNTFMLKVITKCGDTLTSNIAAVYTDIPYSLSIHKNFSVSPNPTHGSFTVAFDSDKPENAQITIYNSIGNIIANLWSGMINLGFNSIALNTDKLNIPSGTYFVVLQSRNHYEAVKINILK